VLPLSTLRAKTGLLGVALALVAALWGCGEATPERPRNLLLVSLDTLRADHLGTYGYARDTSPKLDRWAARGVVFEDATSTAPWTVPAHASLLTGTYPRTHGVRVSAFRWRPAHPTLAQRLARRGFDTAAFLNVVLIEKLMRGFGRLETVPPAEDPAEGAAPAVGGYALEWLAEEREAPFFVFLHHYDAHSPYGARPEILRRFLRPYAGPADGTTEQLKAVRLGALDFDASDHRHLVDRYDAGIRQLDADLGAFLDAAEARGLLRDTLVVITSDHGEEFGEHGDVLHGRTLHQELVRVPLIVVGPGVPAGVRVNTPVSLVDVVPTAAALLGLPRGEGVEGRDLTPLWRSDADAPEPRALFAEADYWLAQPEGVRRRAMRLGHWTLHHDSAAESPALYDLSRDPGEQTDLAARRPERVRELAARLERFLAGGDPSEPPLPPVTDEEARQLRALGYLE